MAQSIASVYTVHIFIPFPTQYLYKYWPKDATSHVTEADKSPQKLILSIFSNMFMSQKICYTSVNLIAELVRCQNLVPLTISCLLHLITGISWTLFCAINCMYEITLLWL